MSAADSTVTLVPDRERAIRSIKILLFSASILPALVGGAIAYAAGAWEPELFLLATLGLFIGQAGGDYVYYYGTHFHTDARDAHTKIFAGWRPLFTGSLLKPELTLHAGIACLFLDLGIASYFVYVRGTTILWFALAGGELFDGFEEFALTARAGAPELGLVAVFAAEPGERDA
jgi:1,4-dihydroxy-2-naphthoate octaprenyltransferase